MKPRLISFIPAFIWFIISFILLIMPGKDIPQEDFLDAIYFDKWVHTGMFAVLVVLFCYPFFKMHKASLKLFVIVMILCIAYGISMEYVQKYFAEGRNFDITDMIADSIGCILGFFFLKYTLKKKMSIYT